MIADDAGRGGRRGRRRRCTTCPTPSVVVTGPVVVDSRDVGPGGAVRRRQGRAGRRPRLRGAGGRPPARSRCSASATGRRCPAVVVADVAGGPGPARAQRCSTGCRTLHGRRRHRLRRARPPPRTSSPRCWRAAPTVAPAGSYNNEIGLPLTVLRADEATARPGPRDGRPRRRPHRVPDPDRPPRDRGRAQRRHARTWGSSARSRRSPQAKGELVEALPAGRRSPCSTPTTRWCAAMAAGRRRRVVAVGRSPERRRAGRGRRLVGRAAAPSFMLVTPRGRGAGHAAAASVAHQVSQRAGRRRRRLGRWGWRVDEVAEALSAAAAAQPLAHGGHRARRRRHGGQRRLQREPRVGARRRWRRSSALAGGTDAPGPCSARCSSSATATSSEHDAVSGGWPPASASTGSSSSVEARASHARARGAGRIIGTRAACVLPTSDAAVELLRARLQPGDVVLVKASRAARPASASRRARADRRRRAREAHPRRGRRRPDHRPVRHPAAHPLPPSATATPRRSATSPTATTRPTRPSAAPRRWAALIIVGGTLVGYAGGAPLHLAAPVRVRAARAVPHDRARRCVGFVDDYIKIFRQRSAGLRASVKLGGQAVVAVVVRRCSSLRFPDRHGLHAGLARRLVRPRHALASCPPGLFVVWVFADGRRDVQRREPHRRPRRSGHRHVA